MKMCHYLTVFSLCLLVVVSKAEPPKPATKASSECSLLSGDDFYALFYLFEDVDFYMNGSAHFPYPGGKIRTDEYKRTGYSMLSRIAKNIKTDYLEIIKQTETTTIFLDYFDDNKYYANSFKHWYRNTAWFGFGYASTHMLDKRKKQPLKKPVLLLALGPLACGTHINCSKAFEQSFPFYPLTYIIEYATNSKADYRNYSDKILSRTFFYDPDEHDAFTENITRIMCQELLVEIGKMNSTEVTNGTLNESLPIRLTPEILSTMKLKRGHTSFFSNYFIIILLSGLTLMIICLTAVIFTITRKRKKSRSNKIKDAPASASTKKTQSKSNTASSSMETSPSGKKTLGPVAPATMLPDISTKKVPNDKGSKEDMDIFPDSRHSGLGTPENRTEPNQATKTPVRESKQVSRSTVKSISQKIDCVKSTKSPERKGTASEHYIRLNPMKR